MPPALGSAQAHAGQPSRGEDQPMPSKHSNTATATLDQQRLPSIPRIELNAETLAKVTAPTKKIQSEEDTTKWIQSESYSIYILFLQRICEACVGKSTRLAPPPREETSHTDTDTVPSRMRRLVNLLYELDSWTDQIEPQRSPQRFGNLAFRTWGTRLEQRIDQLHRDLLPESLYPIIPELKAYLLDSFGSFVRIDYGSGHEFAFFAWICLLYRISFFESGVEQELESISFDRHPTSPTDVEEQIGLEIFPLYLMVVWRIQDRYGLEPAGSHGVWGLDDFQFLPYVIGAAQLRQQSSLRPMPIVSASADQTVLEQLGDRDPTALVFTPIKIPVSLLAPPNGSEESEPVLPNLYLSSLLRIRVLKRGPFHEHSPLLHDISTSVPNWIKVYSGMLKMYQAECLNKKVVVQHFPFGGLGWVWDDQQSGSAQVFTSLAASANAASNNSTSSSANRASNLALGGTSGNMGSMGVPTTRILARGTMMPPTVIPSGVMSSAAMPPPTRAPFAVSASTATSRTRPPTMRPSLDRRGMPPPPP